MKYANLVMEMERWKKAYDATLEVMQDYGHDPKETKEGLKNYLQWLFNQKIAPDFSNYEIESLVYFIFDLRDGGRLEIYDVRRDKIPCLNDSQMKILKEADVIEFLCCEVKEFNFRSLEEALKELGDIVVEEVEKWRSLGADISYPVLEQIFGSVIEWEAGYFEIRRVYGVNAYILVYAADYAEAFYDYLNDF